MEKITIENPVAYDLLEERIDQGDVAVFRRDINPILEPVICRYHIEVRDGVAIVYYNGSLSPAPIAIKEGESLDMVVCNSGLNKKPPILKRK